MGAEEVGKASTALVQIDPKPVSADYRKEVSEVAAAIKALIVNSASSAEKGSELGSQAKALRGKIEKHRKDYVEPFKKHTTAVDTLFGEERDRALAAEKEMSRKCADYKIAEKHKADEVVAAENRRLNKNYDARTKTAEAAGREAPPPPAEATAEVSNKVGTAKVQEAWDYDEQAVDLAKVPERFIKKELRRAEVLKAINQEGAREIPGLKISPKADTRFS